MKKRLDRSKSMVSTVALLCAIFLVLGGTAIVSGVSGATIWTTDINGNPQQDFAPDTIVYIHGENFLGDSNIDVEVTRPDSAVEGGSATSEADGTFVYEYDLNGIEGEYSVLATDGDNIATTTFTDSIKTLNLHYPEASGLVLSGTENINLNVDKSGSGGTVYFYYSSTGCGHNVPSSTGGDANWIYIGDEYYTSDGDKNYAWDTTSVPDGINYCILIWDGESGKGKDYDKSNNPFEIDNGPAIEYCQGADEIISVDMWVVGQDCHHGPKVDSHLITPLVGIHEMRGVVERGTSQDCQAYEEFYIEVNGDNGPVVQDEPNPCEPMTVTEENLGSFFFDGSLTEVFMHTAATCPPGQTANSVYLTELCIYYGEEGECEFDYECDDGNPCTLDECVKDSPGICVNTPIRDTTGPVTSNVVADPIFNNGIFDLTAIATDECSDIEESEYFLGHIESLKGCGDVGTGTSMDAVDGSFDEVIEDVIKTNANLFTDGVNWACVQSKDTSDNWGNCECINFETDIIPPNCPYDMKIGDELYPDEYLICGDTPEVSAKVCDNQAGIQGGEYFFDLPEGYVPAPWSGWWMDIVYNFTDSGLLCSEISAILNTTDLEDGTHYVKIRGKDRVENWGKILNCEEISFIKDTTPPVTEKTIEFADGESFPCKDQTAMGETLTDGCYYVKPGTQIHLTSYDPDPQGTGEFAGDVVINYIVWWSYDGGLWEVVDQGQSNPDEGISITLHNDSYHLIEYWSTDGCTWEEEHHFELDIVDSKHPISWKTLGSPKVECSADDKALYGIDDCWYITQDTDIDLYCDDQDPHPVGGETIFYKIDWKENWKDPWQEGRWMEDSDHYSFRYGKDSFHRLTWYCEDRLGNIERQHVELDLVDTQPPELNKTVGDPKVPVIGGVAELEGVECVEGAEDAMCGPFDWFVTQNTPITLSCEDLGPHPSDNVTIHWYWMWKYRHGDSPQRSPDYWHNGNTVTFNFTEDSFHKLFYWCEDALGNVVRKVEWDIVDTQAPVTDKQVGSPKYPGRGEIDWWITQNTPIRLNCRDLMPHPVDDVTLYWRDYLVDETPGDWVVEEDGRAVIRKAEDCLHVLEWYCVDALGNTEVQQIEYDQVDTAPPEINKFVVKDGERIYSPDDGFVEIAINSGETLKFCAEVNDVKQTGDPGVGVKRVWARFSEIDDPELIWDEGEQAYCHNKTARQCGYWHYEVNAKDHLNNVAGWTNGIRVIVDNVPPIGEVLDPHAGNNYYPGKLFRFYAPAVDFGGDQCCEDTDCPASGVDYCDVYAIDFDFEALDQDEIKECYWDLWKYFMQVLADPYVEYIGRVPYEDGVCKGFLEIPEDTQLTDTVFMGVGWVDKAGNSRMGLALNPWLSPITMNMEEVGYMSITEIFDDPVTSDDLLNVKADLMESELSGNKECVGIVEKYGDDIEDLKIINNGGGELEHIMTYVGDVTGNAIDGWECSLSGFLPGYEDLETGYYRYTVEYRLNDDLQVFPIDSEWFDFMVDNDRPEMGVIAPEEGGVYGELMQVSLYITDEIAGVADDSVKVKVTEKGTISNGWCLFDDCLETDWVLLSYFGDDLYTGTIDFSDYGIDGSGEYNFEAWACDELYDPCEDGDCNDGLGYLLDTRNLHHCVPVSDSFVEERPECNDGLDNDWDNNVDYPEDFGCDSLEDDNELGDVVEDCGNGIPEGDEECDLGGLNGIACIPDYDDTCQYCSENCELVDLDGPYCGDGFIDLGFEECEFDGDCPGSMCQGTPDTDACEVYDEDQCLGIDGCDWVPDGLTVQGAQIYNVGDLVHELDVNDLPVPGYENHCSIGLTFDGEALYYNICRKTRIYKINPLDGTLLRTFDTGIEYPNAMAYDAKRNGIWFGSQDCDGNGMPIYFWDFSDDSVNLIFHVPYGQLLGLCFTDGLAYNENDPNTDADDEIWFSDDVDDIIGLFRPDGTFVDTYNPTLIDPSLSMTSGLAVGGPNLYLGNNGGGDVFRADIDTWTTLGEFASTSDRVEDMACDPVTFAPTEVMWVRHTPQSNPADDIITAHAIEPGTCGVGGEVPEDYMCIGTPIDDCYDLENFWQGKCDETPGCYWTLDEICLDCSCVVPR